MVMVEMGALDKHLGKGLSRVTHWHHCEQVPWPLL